MFSYPIKSLAVNKSISGDAMGLGDYDIYPENGDYEVINSFIASRENINLRFLFFTIDVR